jgi:hypothetical protein
MPYVSGGFNSTISIYDQDGTVGHTLTTDGGANSYLVKYDNNLNVDWATKMGIISNQTITTDSFNNVYFAGSYNNENIANGIAHLYNQYGTTAYTIPNNYGTYENIVLAKYGTTGSVTWATTIQGSLSEAMNNIKTDKNNNVYLFLTSGSDPIQIYNQGSTTYTSFETYPNKNNAVLIKYSNNGVYNWGTYYVPSNQSTITINDGAIDGSNNVYMTGHGSTLYNIYNRGDTLQYELPATNAIIIKYSDTGFVQWKNYIGSTSVVGTIQINSTITDISNNLYVTGSYGKDININLYNSGSTAIVKTLPGNGDNDAFLVKYSDTGYVQWGTRISGPQDQFGYSVNLNSLNQLCVSGIFGADTTFYNADDTSSISLTSTRQSSFIANYDNSGVCKWATKISPSPDTNNAIRMINNSATIQNDNIYVGVYTDSSYINVYDVSDQNKANKKIDSGSTGNNYYNSFLVKFDNLGNVKYATTIKSTGSNAVSNLSYIPAIEPEYDSSKNMIQFDYPENYGLTGIDIYELSGNNIINSIQLRNDDVPTPANGICKVDISGIQLMGDVKNPYMLNTINSNPHQFYLGILGDNKYTPTLTFSCNDNESVPTIGTPVFNNNTNVITFTNTNSNFGTIQQIDLYKVAENANKQRYISHSAQSVAFNPTTYSIDTTGITLKSETGGQAIYVENGNYYLGIVRSPTPQNLGVTFYISDFFDIIEKNYIYVTGQYKSKPLTLYNVDGVGHTTLDNVGNNDVFIAKYSDTGYVTWATRIIGSTSDIGYSVATDSFNNLYVVGSYGSTAFSFYNSDGSFTPITFGNSGGSDVFGARYSDTGYIQGAIRMAGSGDDIGYSVTTDSLDNAYVCGSYKNKLTIFEPTGDVFTTLDNSGNDDTFIAKYGFNGFGQWATRISGLGNESGIDVVTDKSNNMYITGQYGNSPITLFDTNGNGGATLGNSGYGNVFIAKYDNSGYVQWATYIGGTGNNSGYSIASDSLNNVYVTGFYNNYITLYNVNGNNGATLINSGDRDTFIAKYSDTGYVQWATRIAGSTADTGNGIATDSLNNVYVTGQYGSTSLALYNINGTSTTLSNSGLSDVFIAKYSDTGYVKWANRIAGSSGDIGRSIAIDKTNNVYVTGFYGSTALTVYDISSTIPTTLGNSGFNDIFIAKFNETGNFQWITKLAGSDDDRGLSIIASK